MVVFDVVWKIDFWDDIKHALLDNHLGGRIAITTCNWEVANFCRKSSPIHVYKLQPLPPNEAWELFCKGGSNLILEDIVPKCWRNCLMSLWKSVKDYH